MVKYHTMDKYGKGVFYMDAVVKIIVCVVGLIAVWLTFKAQFFLEKVIHKEATPKAVMRVKYVALALAVAAFIIVFLMK